MLTRLKVSGFKNLVDVDVRFGPFTCVAGANGVGKSNLFDAIRFLSAIADRPLIDAALSVRDESGRAGDVRSLFHRVGDDYVKEMSFEAEMIVPSEGVDDLGQKAKTPVTFLRYAVTLAYRADDIFRSMGALELLKEELVHINLDDANKHLLFSHNPTWLKSAVKDEWIVSPPPIISTEGEGADRAIKQYRYAITGELLSQSEIHLPLVRTVLSVANLADNPTALLARREMQSWSLVLLEPSSLRQPDEFTAPTKLGKDGSYLAATLYHLAWFNKNRPNGQSDEDVAAQIYARVANRLAGLIDDVYEVGIDRDERRELLTLYVTNRDGTSHPARALSDGTLRFLALAVLELYPEAQGLLCLEEPENGIHPERITAMLQLLEDIAIDVYERIDPENPLRQVIINTHSPAVVEQVPDDSLLVAQLKQTVRFSGGDATRSRQRFKRVCFSCLPDTWREKAPEEVSLVSKGELLAYLNPVAPKELEPEDNGQTASDPESEHTQPKKRRVVDREDLQLLIPGFPTTWE